MSEQIRCEKCGAVVGEIVQIPPVCLLRIGILLVSVVSATCDCCGEEFHFNAAGYKFNRIIREWKAKEAKSAV